MGLFEMLRRREQAESVAVPSLAAHRKSGSKAIDGEAPSRAVAEEPRLAAVLGSSSARSPSGRLDRRLVDLGEPRSTSPSPAGMASEPPPGDRAPEFRETEVRPEALAHFHQLPPYQALLTVGPEAVYQLPALLHEKLIALDCGARQARLVRATMPAADKLALDGTAKAVKGALRARGYGIVGELVAEPHVLKEILRNAGASGKGGPKGGPMQLFERWIALAVPTGATDLHIEVRRNTAVVRIRIDGRIEALPDGQGGRYSRKEVVDAIAAGYNSTRKGNNVSQYNADQFVDCMIDLDLPGTAGQLRYQNVKGRLGPKTVVRILRTGDENRIRFDAAGYAPSHLRLLRLAGRAGKGIVLLSGVTSSGKSTSLKSFIETLPGLDQKAIYTVEDPIEYEIAGAHQIEVLRDIANDDETRRRYAEVMRALMRSDPDGVMLGEIRDKLTALFALQIAETGHLAMGTVHAHLISNIIPRLTNDQIGVSRQALTGPNILNLLVYQALVPKLCRCCALPTALALRVDPDAREIEEVLRRRFGLATARLRWTRPEGCAACQGRGTHGKTIVAEMLQPDRAWLRHVRNNDDDAALQHFRSASNRQFDSADMTGKTVFEHALYKALQGEIDVRNCEEFDGFERFEILPAERP
ncbi:GspE/PulE family protein [Scleromatobacter humisilvae]|uniref:Flp pilus assembly complex ATPase component TadA n=1 Tax=Scleromatobacter humisilvae TaxID=2897159 RepID=A0A9X1YLJ6_9BURK|nr:ATPase, T2SS/T4P/T4SS family [Scleromatobacter humisilvae]MCK9686983.1 Flp pilus assembly complex ATPase component TadA [Scleromatobacter humisilvae]